MSNSNNPTRLFITKDFQVEYSQQDCKIKEMLSFNEKYILHSIKYTYPQSEYRNYYLYKQLVSFKINIKPNTKTAELEFVFSNQNQWFKFGGQIGIEITYAEEIEKFIIENIIAIL